MVYFWGVIFLIILAVCILAHFSLKKEREENRETFYNLKRGRINRSNVYNLTLISWFYDEKGENIKNLIDLFKNRKLKFEGKIIGIYKCTGNDYEPSEIEANLNIDYTEGENGNENKILTRKCMLIVSSYFEDFDSYLEVIIKSDFNRLMDCEDLDITFEGILQIDEDGDLEFTNVSNIQIEDNKHENLEIIYFDKE